MSPGKPKNADLIKPEAVCQLLLELSGVTRCRATVYSWIKKGRINCTGQMIKLKATKRLGMYYTTREWVKDFIREIG